MQVEHGLAGALADVDEDAVVVEALQPGDVGDEVEHGLRLVLLERRHLAKRVDVALGDDEEVDVGARVDVADRDEPVDGRDVVAVAVQLAEEAVVRQRARPPP